jgi:hypothetical protein
MLRERLHARDAARETDPAHADASA